MLSAQDVADFFILPALEDDGELITNLKLQKLLYYAQGYSLAILDRPIFPEKIEHWTHGPVVHEIYHKYKNYGSLPIPAKQVDFNKYSDEDLYILNRVRAEKGDYSARGLRNKTHREEPWLNTRNGEEITIFQISSFFKKLLPKSDFNFDLETIKKSIESGFEVVPEFDNQEDLMKWMLR